MFSTSQLPAILDKPDLFQSHDSLQVPDQDQDQD